MNMIICDAIQGYRLEICIMITLIMYHTTNLMTQKLICIPTGEINKIIQILK